MKIKEKTRLTSAQQEVIGMFDWIIEADVYRLRKAAREATNPRERREIEALAEQKVAILGSRTESGRISASA